MLEILKGLNSRDPFSSRHCILVLSVLFLVIVLTGCSYFGGETPPPTPTATQLAIIEPSATAPAEPTPTPQALPPRLVETDPLPDSEVALEGNITFYFNQPMDRASVETAFSGLSGEFDWVDDATLVFSPFNPLVPAAEINLQFDTKARALNGLPLVNPINLKFQTVGYLYLAQALPEDGANSVNPSSAVIAAFNRPIVPLGEAQVSLPEAFSIEPTVAGRGEWLNTSTYIFYPRPSMEGGEEFTVRINDDLTGLDGSPLQTHQDWSFTTERPRLVSIDPADGSREISLDTSVHLTFNQPMDPDSVIEYITILDRNSIHISGEFTWNEEATEFSFTPDILLKRDWVYTLTVSGETLSSGGTSLGAKQESSFRTIPDLTVIRSDPGEGGLKDVYNSVAIYFNSPIRLSDVLSFITISPEIPDMQAFVDEESRTLWVNGFYSPDTNYTLIISPNLPDKWNGRLGQEYSLNFRTRSLDPALMVSFGSDLLFLTPQQSSILVQVTNLDELHYSLGRVPFEDFQDLIAPDSYEMRQSYHPPGERTTVFPLNILANQSTLIELPLSLDGSPLSPGFYILRFNLEEDYIYPGPYLLVVSNINTTFKISATDALVWAVDLRDGTFVRDLPVAIYSEKGELLAEGLTDAEGVLYVDIPVREMEDVYGTSYAVINEAGQDDFSAAVSNWSQGLQGGSFGYRVDYTPPHLEAYLYTDRPVYRPGQVVHFRAIVREVYNGRYNLPDQTHFTLNLMNDFGEQIATLDLPLSDLGTAKGQYTLPEDIEPGIYRLISELADFSSVSFQVAEYRKPEIDLSVSFPANQAMAGETLTATVMARFFFDAPAGNVPMEWTLFRTPATYYLPGYQVGKLDNRWFFPYQDFFPPGFEEQVSQGEGVTDPAGILEIDLAFPLAEDRYEYTLEVTATDESGLPVSARANLPVNPAEFYIGVNPDAWSGQAGREIGFDVQVVDWEQEPAGQQSLRAEFLKVIWKLIEPDPGSFRNLPTYEPQYTPVGSTDFLTGEDGKARVAFTPPEPGTYQLGVSDKDLDSKGAVTQVLLWVGGPGQAVWPKLPNQRLRLIPDKDSYQPGDVAHVFIPNPFTEGALALITIERGILFDHQVREVSGSGIDISVPLGNEEAPNVYLSVTSVKPNDTGTPDYRQGYLILPVKPVEQTFNVSLISDPVTTKPGEEVALELLITDAQGEPVEGEFSLSVVDLAVLALADPNSEEIVPAFYGEQPLGVNTSLSLAGSTQLQSFGPEGIGGGGGGEMASPIQLREEFLDTAYWNAAILTHADGRARTRLTLPDNLTTWKIDARGVTEDTRVGQGEELLVATKDLLVRPITPRFLVLGDRSLLAAIVHNNTQDDLQVEVSLQSMGFELDEPHLALQQVLIPAGGRERIEWWGTVQDVDSVDLIFSAGAGDLHDASRPTGGALPVLRFTAPQSFATSGLLDEGGDRLEVISLPRSFDPSGGELGLEMAPTLGAAMMNALDVLENYPSSSNECLVSRFLPNLETYRVVQEFGLTDPELQSRLDRTLAESLGQLTSRQNLDGGWGWWMEGESDPYITAYVLFALIRARDAGVDIESKTVDSVIDYLHATLTTPEMLSETWQFDRLVFVHYVLSQAGAGDPGGVFDLYDRRQQLNPWAQALLALSMESLSPGDNRIQTLYSDLELGVTRSATGAHWENQEPSWRNMSTTIHSTAVVLYTLAKHDPDSPLVADALRFLMSHRDASGAWTSTYETAWTLMAASEVMRSTGELSGDFDYSAILNGAPLVTGEASDVSQLTPVEALVPISELFLDDPNSLIFQRGDGPGRLYYNTHLTVNRPVEDAASLDMGINISRAYYLSGAECPGGECVRIQSGEAGDVVEVRLTLTIPDNAYYLLVEDYIPAGSEVIDTSLKTSQQGVVPQFNPLAPFEDGWGWWYFNSPQIHDDRISWTADILPPGTYELTYQIVLLHPGEYRALPAQARQLYFPEVQGNSTGEIFEIGE